MNLRQAPHSILMIRPLAFGFNEQTSGSNAFQQPAEENAGIHEKAIEEFNAMVDRLRAHEIRVFDFEDTREPIKPDVVFPNNWVSFHPDGKVILYPMMAENRRAERRTDILDQLMTECEITERFDLSFEENNGAYLEGTGSLVFDHVNMLAYVCRSPRTDERLVQRVCDVLHYKPIIFDAVDSNGIPIYHTNVVMNVGSKTAVICLDAIRSESDQENILASLTTTGLKVVAISYAQMTAFAGNMLEVQNVHGELFLIMSTTAFNSLLPGQVDALSKFVDIITIPVDTIEHYGGGSVRCMMAGIYLPFRAGNEGKL